MLSTTDLALIEKYLIRKLDEKEVQQFEERMKDHLFAEELQLYQSVQKATIDIGREEIRHEFATWDAEETSGKKINLPKWSRMKTAAAILLLVTVGILVTYFRSQKSPQQLYHAYYEPYPNLIDPLQKGELDGTASLSQLYEMSNYAQSEKMVPRDSLEAFYLALSHLPLHHFEAAISALQEIANLPNHRFQKAAQWYLALAYLQTDPERSRSILSEISQSDKHDFSKNATELLKKLN